MREKGTISHYNPRGFGFLQVAGRANLFFHVSDVANFEDESKLQPGRPVEFEIGENGKGPCARDVVLL